ncbi:MAG: DUF1015 family protein [Phycisphaerales bacterium]
MLRIRPFHALRPAGSRAALVSCPPPTRACEAAPDGETSDNYRQVFEAAGNNGAAAVVRRLVDRGALCADSEPRLYLYRITRDGHRVLGVVALVDCADFDGDAVRPDAAEWREPATASFDDPEGTIASLAACDMNERPIFHFNAADGTTHTAWLVHDAPPYVEAFAALGGRASLISPGASAGEGQMLTLLVARSEVGDACRHAPIPRCGLFVQCSVLAPERTT